MDLSVDQFYNILQKQYYVQIPFLVDNNIIEQSIAAYFNFLQLPESIKKHIDFTIVPNLGYKHRDPKDDIVNTNQSIVCQTSGSAVLTYLNVGSRSSTTRFPPIDLICNDYIYNDKKEFFHFHPAVFPEIAIILLIVK